MQATDYVAGTEPGYIPLGWSATVPSALTGRSLHYFTPYPLSRLLRALPDAAGSAFKLDPLAGELFACAVYGAIVRQRAYEAAGDAPARVLELFKRLLLSPTVDIGSPNRVLEISTILAGSKAGRYRREIVYAGQVAAESSTLYAVEDEIPALMDDLGASITHLDSGSSPAELAALVLFVAISIHPFLDGNGRFARLAAILSSRQAGHIASGALVAAVQRANRPWFRSTCMSARTSGMHEYLTAYMAATEAAASALEQCGVTSCFDALARFLQDSPAQSKSLRILLIDGLLGGQLKSAAIQKALGCSTRKASGIVDSVAGLHPLLVQADGTFSALADAIGQSVSHHHQEK